MEKSARTSGVAEVASGEAREPLRMPPQVRVHGSFIGLTMDRNSASVWLRAARVGMVAEAPSESTHVKLVGEDEMHRVQEAPLAILDAIENVEAGGGL